MQKDVNGGMNLQDRNPISDSLDKLSGAELIEEQIFGLPSPNITQQDMLKLSHAITHKVRSKHIDGVVVTHGTDTLEETAYFLELTVPPIVPVVVTGAMRPVGELGSDALYNYQCAIRVAMSDSAKHVGTTVVFNGEIHDAKDVTKINTTNVAAFQSPGSGIIGFVTDKSVVFTRSLPQRPHYDITGITKNVMLIKAFAGMDKSIFDAFDALAEKLGHYPFDGLVIEAFGAGNLPQRLIDCLKKLTNMGIPIVLASRCPVGTVESLYDYPGGGMNLKEKEVKDIIFSNGLSGVKSRLKLAVLLEKTCDIKELESEFMR